MDAEGEQMRKLQEVELLRKQGEAMQQQLLLIEKTLEEIGKTKSALKDIQNLKGDEEMFFPLGSGVYGKGRLSSKDEVFVNIGSELMAAKSLSEARELLGAQEEKMREAEKKIAEGLAGLDKDLGKIIGELQGGKHVHGPDCGHEE